jgi:hypothetical protein
MEGNPQSRLTVKLQYKNYEEGEFAKAQPQTAEDTFRLITAYPWDEQRDHLVIGLTNPSVTVEGANNDFLKLSPFYGGKWVLHFFDRERHLYTQSFSQLSDTFPPIQSFFGNESFDLTGFKKETTWLQSNAAHFRTGNFSYSLNITSLFWPSILMIFILFASFIWIMGMLALSHSFAWAIFPPLALLVLLTRVASLAINHYRAAKGKILLLSRGKEEFSFGNIERPVTYYKKDIEQIITYGRRGRGGYPPLTRVEILFTDGSSIDISCLMIRQETIVGKFPDVAQSIIPKTWCFIQL